MLIKLTNNSKRKLCNTLTHLNMIPLNLLNIPTSKSS